MDAILWSFFLFGKVLAIPYPQNGNPGGTGNLPTITTTTGWNSTTTNPSTTSFAPSTSSTAASTDSALTTSDVAVPVLTSTVKSTPAGFSTGTLTGITANTIIHTTGPDGQPTDVAVVRDDDDDDDNDVGIILWGIPLIAGVLFDLPLATIPNFFIPCPGCIPVTQPGTEGSDPPDDPDDPTSDGNNPSSNPPSTTNAPSTMQSSTETSSSSSSSSSAPACQKPNDGTDPYNTMNAPTYFPPSVSGVSTDASASATSDTVSASTTSDLVSTSSDASSSASVSASTPSSTSDISSTSTSASETNTPSATSDQSSTITSAPFPSATIISSSIWYGPTSMCIGLSPGGPPECITISGGCWATTPGWNFIPSTTCSGDPIPTSTSSSTPPPPPASTTSSPPAEPTRPTNQNCYSGKVHDPFISFTEHDPDPHVADFCHQYVNNNDGYPNTWLKSYPMDGKTWIDSKYQVELEIIHRCDDPNPKVDLEEQCKFALGAIVFDCDWGSGTKWGGTGDWKCMSYKINGNSGMVTTSWEGNGAQ